ncbi:MAG TPA: hypothetical protein PK390_05600 [Fervidobacterium nodosum]|nr:hypothetical protein [Fervidobacterium nodosum]
MFKRDQNIGYISKNPQLALYYIRYLQELTGVDLTVKTIKSIMKRTGLQIPAGDLSFKMVRERIRDNRGRTKIRHKLVASGARTTQ